MKLYRDEALVLRTHKLGEADRIITLLTRASGRVRAVAKGVRRTTSKFGARLEPFALIEVQLYSGRNLDTITQAETQEPYGSKLGTDYQLYTAATAMAETAERLTEVEQEPSPQQFLLLLGALHSLATRRHDAGLVLDSYLLRAMAVAGWALSCDQCAQCGKTGPHSAFHVAAGGAQCSTCRPPGSASPAPETFELLGALLSGDWPQAEDAEARHRSEASGLVAAHLQYHLERRLRSLRHVERV